MQRFTLGTTRSAQSTTAAGRPLDWSPTATSIHPHHTRRCLRSPRQLRHHPHLPCRRPIPPCRHRSPHRHLLHRRYHRRRPHHHRRLHHLLCRHHHRRYHHHRHLRSHRSHRPHRPSHHHHSCRRHRPPSPPPLPPPSPPMPPPHHRRYTHHHRNHRTTSAIAATPVRVLFNLPHQSRSGSSLLECGGLPRRHLLGSREQCRGESHSNDRNDARVDRQQRIRQLLLQLVTKSAELVVEFVRPDILGGMVRQHCAWLPVREVG